MACATISPAGQFPLALLQLFSSTASESVDLLKTPNLPTADLMAAGVGGMKRGGEGSSFPCCLKLVHCL